jgi:ribonucleoside-diphosphate reductase beta chain
MTPSSTKSILLKEPGLSLQLHPLKYPWAWDLYLRMLENNWHPQEIQMAPDVSQWRREEIPPFLQHAFLTIFSQLTTFDFQRAVDLSEVLIPLVQAPEIKNALIKQAEQEALHTFSYQFCIENLGLDQQDIYSRWERVPILRERVEYANRVSEEMRALAAAAPSPENRARFAAGLAFWFLGFEGVWFMLNLRGPVQAMSRYGMMTATAEQFQYIARDEDTHINLGVHLIRGLLQEERIDPNGPFLSHLLEHFDQVLELEARFIDEAFSSPWPGYGKGLHISMAKWLIDLRLKALGLPPVHNLPSCPIPWMDEMVGLKKEKNFFETRVTEYRTGNSLRWDDDDEAEVGLLL